MGRYKQTCWYAATSVEKTAAKPHLAERPETYAHSGPRPAARSVKADKKCHTRQENCAKTKNAQQKQNRKTKNHCVW
jgi:hypothetical protein